MPSHFDEQIRAIVGDHGRLIVDVTSLRRDSDLYSAGMTSHASIGVMLALEERFGVEFPERLLTPRVFSSIAAISDALNELLNRRTAHAA